MTTYEELKAQAAELLKQAEALRNAETRTVIGEIKAKMAEYGITLDDLKMPSRRGAKKAKGAAVKPKYRNPETGATWCGRGRSPKWLVDELAKGRAREDFLFGKRSDVKDSHDR